MPDDKKNPGPGIPRRAVLRGAAALAAAGTFGAGLPRAAVAATEQAVDPGEIPSDHPDPEQLARDLGKAQGR